MIKVKIVNTNNYVEKKELSANLGGVLADSGYCVQLIDVEQKPSLSDFSFLDNQDDYGLKEFLVNLLSDNTIKQTETETETESQVIIVSDDPNSKLRDCIGNTPDGFIRLEHILSFLEDQYDFLLIDTQESGSSYQDTDVLPDCITYSINSGYLPSSDLICGTVSSDLFLLSNMVKKVHEISGVGHTLNEQPIV